MRGFLLMAGVAALQLASALAAPTAARASCAAALVVDGVVLYGTSLEAVPGVIPPRGAPSRDRAGVQ